VFVFMIEPRSRPKPFEPMSFPACSGEAAHRLSRRVPSPARNGRKLPIADFNPRLEPGEERLPAPTRRSESY
jgi:hypothetical protein